MNTTARIKTSTLLIGIGIMLLASTNLYPDMALQLGTWPVTLGLIGILISILSRFKHPLGYALLLIGIFFQLTTDLPLLAHWYLPLLFICIGVLLLFVTNHPHILSNEKEQLS